MMPEPVQVYDGDGDGEKFIPLRQVRYFGRLQLEAERVKASCVDSVELFWEIQILKPSKKTRDILEAIERYLRDDDEVRGGIVETGAHLKIDQMKQGFEIVGIDTPYQHKVLEEPQISKNRPIVLCLEFLPF